MLMFYMKALVPAAPEYTQLSNESLGVQTWSGPSAAGNEG